MTEAKRPLKVFLCHAHSDKDAVKALYARLTQDGVDAWLDKEKLIPGQEWELEIRRAVREADVVVVCLSKQFNQAGFRQKEVRLALDTAMEKPEGEIFIIPARFEECETLESLKKWHWVDLFDQNGYFKLMKALDERALHLKLATVKFSKPNETNSNQAILLPVDSSSNELMEDGIKVFFSHIVKPVMDMLFSRQVLLCGFFGVFVAGFIWNILNNLLDWPYFLGGPGNEPHGFSAFLWGSIVIFPVAFFAHLAFYKYILASWRVLWKAPLIISLYTIFGGIGATVFYDSGFRNFIVEQNLGYGTQELIIVSVWALVISLLVSLPVLILNRAFKEVLNIRIVFFQIPFCTVISFLAVVVSLFIRMPEIQAAGIRGILAGLGLRFGLFIGIVLSIFLKPTVINNSLLDATKATEF